MVWRCCYQLIAACAVLSAVISTPTLPPSFTGSDTSHTQFSTFVLTTTSSPFVPVLSPSPHTSSPFTLSTSTHITSPLPLTQTPTLTTSHTVPISSPLTLSTSTHITSSLPLTQTPTLTTSHTVPISSPLTLSTSSHITSSLPLTHLPTLTTSHTVPISSPLTLSTSSHITSSLPLTHSQTLTTSHTVPTSSPLTLSTSSHITSPHTHTTTLTISHTAPTSSPLTLSTSSHYITPTSESVTTSSLHLSQSPINSKTFRPLEFIKENPVTAALGIALIITSVLLVLSCGIICCQRRSKRKYKSVGTPANLLNYTIPQGAMGITPNENAAIYEAIEDSRTRVSTQTFQESHHVPSSQPVKRGAKNVPRKYDSTEPNVQSIYELDDVMENKGTADQCTSGMESAVSSAEPVAAEQGKSSARNDVNHHTESIYEMDDLLGLGQYISSMKVTGSSNTESLAAEPSVISSDVRESFYEMDDVL